MCLRDAQRFACSAKALCSPSSRQLPFADKEGPSPSRYRAPQTESALAIGFLSVLIYSTGPVMVQASTVSGTVFAVWRLWFGVVVFGLATLVVRRRPFIVDLKRFTPSAWPTTWRSLRWAVWGGAAFGGHQLLFFSALKATSVTDVLLVGTLQPIATALGALMLFGERPGLAFRAWTSVAMLILRKHSN